MDRRGILSAKGAERGGGPHYSDSVRNEVVFCGGRLADLRFGHYITQDAGSRTCRGHDVSCPYEPKTQAGVPVPRNPRRWHESQRYNPKRPA